MMTISCSAAVWVIRLACDAYPLQMGVAVALLMLVTGVTSAVLS